MADGSGADLGLKPVMTLSTELIAVNRVSAGDAVGYGGLWKAEREGRIGIAAIGYGDGYPRCISGAAVLVNGCEAPLAGRVSMDMIAIDLSSAPDARVGDQVVLWGRDLPIERVAQCAGTIGYELACRVNERVLRDVIGQ
jgi:alanine racemase